MKTSLKLALILVIGTASLAHAEDKNTKVTPKPAQTQASTNTPMTIKIAQDDQANMQRHQMFIEELRKLYKANFL